jgi:nitrous oxidase accessory protein
MRGWGTKAIAGSGLRRGTTGVLLAVALLSAVRVEAASLTVDQGESIAAALVKAAPGDTLRLTGSEYRENLVIDVPVVLEGVGLPVIRGGYRGNVIHITANGTVLDGLHVSESGERLTKDMAAILVEADGVTIRNCLVTEPLHGIYVKGGNRTTISGNRIVGRLDLIEADRGNGIHLWNSKHNHLAGNEIRDVRDGIYFSFADSTHTAENHIHHVRYGLHYMYSNHNTFTDNTFDLNVAGAALMYSEDIVFDRNIFARCRGFRAYGVLFQSMSDVTARSNLILDNSRGVFMNNTDSSVIEHNDVVSNDLAVQLNGGCDGNRFSGNNFLNNLSELLQDVSDRDTAWTDGAAGNYWSGYSGYDLDRDGIGDVPFPIQNVFQVMESRVPEVRFYLLSPAAELLGLAERTLPILRLGDAEDSLPRMRAADNAGVPWSRDSGMEATPSPLWAGIYLAGAVGPICLLMYRSRPGRSRRR